MASDENDEDHARILAHCSSFLIALILEWIRSSQGLDKILVVPHFKTTFYHREAKAFHVLDELLDRFTDDLLCLGARAHDAARAEDEKHGLRLLHAINQAGEHLGFVHGILHDD